MVISTHDVNLVSGWADEVWLLNRGRVLARGKPQQLFPRAELLQTAQLETPWLLETWREMAALGLASADSPPAVKTSFKRLCADWLNTGKRLVIRRTFPKIVL